MVTAVAREVPAAARGPEDPAVVADLVAPPAALVVPPAAPVVPPAVLVAPPAGLVAPPAALVAPPAALVAVERVDQRPTAVAPRPVIRRPWRAAVMRAVVQARAR